MALAEQLKGALLGVTPPAGHKRQLRCRLLARIREDSRRTCLPRRHGDVLGEVRRQEPRQLAGQTSRDDEGEIVALRQRPPAARRRGHVATGSAGREGRLVAGALPSAAPSLPSRWRATLGLPDEQIATMRARRANPRHRNARQRRTASCRSRADSLQRRWRSSNATPLTVRTCLAIPRCRMAPPPTQLAHHHERFDGTGYPSGLAGEAIPVGGRIWRLSTRSSR